METLAQQLRTKLEKEKADLLRKKGAPILAFSPSEPVRKEPQASTDFNLEDFEDKEASDRLQRIFVERINLIREAIEALREGNIGKANELEGKAFDELFNDEEAMAFYGKNLNALPEDIEDQVRIYDSTYLAFLELRNKLMPEAEAQERVETEEDERPPFEWQPWDQEEDQEGEWTEDDERELEILLERKREREQLIADIRRELANQKKPGISRRKLLGIGAGVIGAGLAGLKIKEVLDDRNAYIGEVVLIRDNTPEGLERAKLENDPLYRFAVDIMGEKPEDLGFTYRTANVSTINFSESTFEGKVKNTRTIDFKNYHDYLTYRTGLTEDQLDFINTIRWGKENEWTGSTLYSYIWNKLDNPKDPKYQFNEKFHSLLGKALRGELPDNFAKALEILKGNK
jgi:hypothetical protein